MGDEALALGPWSSLLKKSDHHMNSARKSSVARTPMASKFAAKQARAASLPAACSSLKKR